jgi:hypothetical protein
MLRLAIRSAGPLTAAHARNGMSPRALAARKLNLTAHVVSSVGWLGAVVAFLALALVGLWSADPDHTRGTYLTMNTLGQFVVVPFSLAALITGFVQSLLTRWGFFRYYWVAAKLVLTVFATGMVLLHQFLAVAVAAGRVVGTPIGVMPDLGGLRAQLVIDAALGIAVLLVNTSLSIFKPWGPIRREAGSIPSGLKLTLALAVAVVIAILAVHVTGHAPRRH